MNTIARLRDAGDISFEDPRKDTASSTDSCQVSEKCNNFSAQHVARTMTLRLVRSQTLPTSKEK
eukprot:786090-Prorocentrum_lima.AAC.1